MLGGSLSITLSWVNSVLQLFLTGTALQSGCSIFKSILNYLNSGGFLQCFIIITAVQCKQDLFFFNCRLLGNTVGSWELFLTAQRDTPLEMVECAEKPKGFIFASNQRVACSHPPGSLSSWWEWTELTETCRIVSCSPNYSKQIKVWLKSHTHHTHNLRLYYM